jgi:DNA repair/transcription protein MET18/MMS19
LELFPLSHQATTNTEGSSANANVISALHASVIWFRDACEAKYGKELASHAGGDRNWLDEFKQLPDDWLLRLHSQDGSPDAVLPPLKEDDPEVFGQYLKISLFTVRYLYRSASSGPQTSWDERALVQLSQMAALVLRSLDEKLQVACDLAQEAFNFFRGPEEPAAQKQTGALTGLLTLGILQGLRPGALAGLVCSLKMRGEWRCD